MENSIASEPVDERPAPLLVQKALYLDSVRKYNQLAEQGQRVTIVNEDGSVSMILGTWDVSPAARKEYDDWLRNLMEEIDAMPTPVGPFKTNW